MEAERENCPLQTRIVPARQDRGVERTSQGPATDVRQTAIQPFARSRPSSQGQRNACRRTVLSEINSSISKPAECNERVSSPCVKSAITRWECPGIRKTYRRAPTGDAPRPARDEIASSQRRPGGRTSCATGCGRESNLSARPENPAQMSRTRMRFSPPLTIPSVLNIQIQ